MARGGDSTVYMVGDDSGKKKKDDPVLCVVLRSRGRLLPLCRSAFAALCTGGCCRAAAEGRLGRGQQQGHRGEVLAETARLSECR